MIAATSRLRLVVARAPTRRVWHALFVAFAVMSVVVYVAEFWSVIAAGEVFHRFAFDWSLFYAQALAVRDGAGAQMYDATVIDRYLQPLMQYYSGPAPSLTGWPQPYPPFFAVAILPFAFASAPVALALWLVTSLGATLYLAFRVRQFLPDLGLAGACLAILASVPVAWGMFMGQPVVLLAIPVGEMLVSLKAGRDFRAGLWLSVLLLKPQYALLFGVFVLWKRRWYAVAGAVIGAVFLAALGAVGAGPESLLRFPSVAAQLGDLHNPIAGPLVMMNWRALVLAVRPGIGEQAGQVIVWTFSLLTMLAGLILFRGRWQPDSPSFGARFCALSVAALVGSYHSHVHGAALLIVPLAAAWAAPSVSPATRAAIWAAIYAPTFFVVWNIVGVAHLAVSPDPDVPLWTVWPYVLPGLLFLLAFVLLCVDLIGARVARQWRGRPTAYA